MSTGQEAVAVLYSWEGNRRSGITDSVIYPPTGSMASGSKMSNQPKLL